MIGLQNSFNFALSHIFEDLNFPKENEVSFTVEEPDSHWYITKYSIPTKSQFLGMIWVDEYILVFENGLFIGYIDEEKFIAENCDLKEFEPYTAKIRNKLSPVYNFVQLFELWLEEKNPTLKEQQFQILQNELQKSKNNFTKIFYYLNQIALNYE